MEVAMPSTAADPVMARLDRLERESRRWRRVALGSWLAIAALLLLGQSQPQAQRPAGPARPVEAERFVLRDARGRVGATLGWEADSTPRLVLHDPVGQPRTLLTVGAGGAPGLSLLDADGKTVRAALVVGPDGAPGFALFDPAGKPRLAAALFHAGGTGPGKGSEPAPAIAAYDAAGVARATFGLRGTDVAGLELADGRGAARAILRVQPDGAPDFALRDGQGRGRASLGVLSDGTPALNLHGADGKARATMTFVQGKGAALALADGRGAVVWSAPP
jgi:hypothetical protein